jgi:uncharacterized alkaline shock family protein YloU
MGHEPVISPDVLARYAGDAAAEVTGVSALGRAVEIADHDGALGLTVHVELEWGRSASEVGRKVQRRVRDYVESMTNKKVGAVEVVIERVTAPPAS